MIYIMIILSANEIQAYLLQQPLERVEAYFKEYNIPRMMEIFPEHQATLHYMQDEENGHFYDSALMLHQYMERSNGYGAGNLFTVRPGDSG